MSQTLITKTPQKPWKLTPKQLLPDLLGAIFTVVATFAIVALSPLKGKLGFALVLIFMAIITATTISWITRDRKAATNATTTVLVYIAAAFVIIPLASVLYEIVRLGANALSFGMFTTDMSQTASESELSEGGLLHAVIGTAYIVTFATILSTPIGILTALYIVEVKGRLAGPVRFFVQAMSGVPSIVAGLFILAAFILTDVSGFSALTGGLAYSILMLPTVARTAEEVLKLVPKDLRDAAIALGSSRARVIMKIVLPTARTGILTAVILGVARVIGETAPLLLTTSNTNGTNLNPFVDAVSTIPVYIFQFLGSGYPTAINRSWGAAFVLMTTVAILFAIARIVERSTKKG